MIKTDFFHFQMNIKYTFTKKPADRLRLQPLLSCFFIFVRKLTFLKFFVCFLNVIKQIPILFFTRCLQPIFRISSSNRLLVLGLALLKSTIPIERQREQSSTLSSSTHFYLKVVRSRSSKSFAFACVSCFM